MFIKGSEKNILEDVAEFAVLVDTNKLFLFSAMPHTAKEDISEELTTAVKNLLSIKEKIKQNDTVGYYDVGLNNIYGLLTKGLEIWCFPIFEITTLNYFGGTNAGGDDDVIFPFMLMDLKAVFARIDRPFDFLKFLREELNLKKGKVPGSMGEFMDRFAYYLGNENSFFRSGMKMDFVLFEPHIWHYHFMEEQYNRHQDGAFAIIEAEFPDFFNVQKKYKDNIYLGMNTAQLNGAYLARMAKRDVWIMTQISSDKRDPASFHYSYELLMPLFADYLTELDIEFSKFFGLDPSSQQNKYGIFVFSVDFIKDDQHFDYLHPLLSEITPESPLVFDTRRFHGGRIRTTAIFDPEQLQSLFSLPKNQGERFCIKQIAKSVLLYCGEAEEDAETKAQDFIDKNLPLRKKGYSMETFYIENPKLNEYHSPKEQNQTDIATVDRKLSEFLIEQGYESGDYTGKEATELNYKMYCFLQEMLENKITEYGEHFLFYAYSQLELIEGEAKHKKLKAGMQAKGRVMYDVLESTKERENTQSEHSVSIKHIIHTILKTGIKGKKFVTGEVWTELLAIAKALIETAMIYDYIAYDLRKQTLTLNHHYVIELHSGDEAIDSVAYILDRVKIKLSAAKSAHTRATTEPKAETNIESMPEELAELDNAFYEEFGFRYENLIFVLYVLHCLGLHDPRFFPVTILPLDQIVSEVQKNDRRATTAEEIKTIIRFLTLKEGVYSSNDLLIPSEMMRNKERLNVCPFIELKDGRILYGNEVVSNAQRFWGKPLDGDFPYHLPKDSPVQKAINNRHRVLDQYLEEDCEKEAKKALGAKNVEARILNFKRLSPTFSKREPCGEIDLLCSNKTTKTIFVLDAKNINKRSNLYYVRQSIDEFFKGDKSYLSKLEKKRAFIESNLSTILDYFKVEAPKPDQWKVKKAFVTDVAYFAAYSTQSHANFVEIGELQEFLLS